MARSAVVRPNEAQRGEDIGTKSPIEGQRSMAGREQVLLQVTHAFIAAGARFFEIYIARMRAVSMNGRQICSEAR